MFDIDGGSVLFDPEGLDKEELVKIAFQRNSSPRVNSLAFPPEKLSSKGFIVPISAKNITLPDGDIVEDGALFHRQFLSNPKNRKYISLAKIEAFIPCGGYKDTVNHRNVSKFIENFRDLRFIVEGANVFFDDIARRYIATNTAIKHIKDSTANKGGVFSSSISEVLTAFLFQENYEKELLDDTATRCGLIKDIISLVDKYSRLETNLLLQIYDTDRSIPLFDLSEITSEQIFSLQSELAARLDEIIKDEDLVWKVLQQYIPSVLITKVGRESILATLNTEELQPYRDAILSKKLASAAFYQFGSAWSSHLEQLQENFIATLHKSCMDVH